MDAQKTITFWQLSTDTRKVVKSMTINYFLQINGGLRIPIHKGI